MNKIFNLLSIFAIIFLIGATISSKEEGNGIKFFEGTWQEALKKSENENKLIFLDLSTSWCGWCKKMKANTFSNKEVGEYFNAHFINMELDGEHGDGQRLAQKFGVTGYPTIYIIDKNENPVLSSEGYHEPDDLMKLIKAAVKEKK